MDQFFEFTRPGKSITHGVASCEMPILYFRDDLFGLFFTADFEKVKQLMPSDKLHPVKLTNKKTAIAIVAFNYIDTSIGPYGEIPVFIPVVYGKPPLPVVPAIIESKYPGFGALIVHLPVTSKTARDAGRGEWGFTKFIADMHFDITPEYLECRMSEAGKHILNIRVGRKGIFLKDKKPLITYSVKDKSLIKTTIPQVGTLRFAVNPKDSYVNLGDHPVADSIRDLGLGEKPFLSRYYIERSGILPSGEVIEAGVKPLEGYIGKEDEGSHTVSYIRSK